MKKLSLRPFHGSVWYCETYEEFKLAYKKYEKEEYDYDDGGGSVGYGRTILLSRRTDTVYLVWANGESTLAHEMAHAILMACGAIGHNPAEGDGEPFCYLLSSLIDEAKAPKKTRRKKSEPDKTGLSD